MSRAHRTVVATALILGAHATSHAGSAPRAHLDVPIGVSFPALDTTIADQLPPRLTGQEYSYGFRIDYDVRRGDVRVTPRDDTIRVSVDFAYSAEVCKDAGPLGCVRAAACNRQRATATVESQIRLGRRWNVEPATRVVAVEHHTRCVVTALQIDVTSLIASALRNQLDQATGAIDSRIARELDFRRQAEAAWQRLAEPRSTGPFWLALNPESIAASPPRIGSRSAEIDLRLGMSPTLQLGPPANEPATGLPPLGKLESAPTSGFAGEISVLLPMAEINRVLRLPPSGVELDLGPGLGRVTLASVDVAVADKKLVANLAFRKPKNLRATLRLTPRIDRDGNQLGFTVASVAIKGLRDARLEAPLKRRVRAHLEALVIPFDERIAQQIAAPEEIPLGEGRSVNVTFEAIALRAARVGRTAITLVVHVQGDARIKP